VTHLYWTMCNQRNSVSIINMVIILAMTLSSFGDRMSHAYSSFISRVKKIERLSDCFSNELLRKVSENENRFTQKNNYLFFLICLFFFLICVCNDEYSNEIVLVPFRKYTFLLHFLNLGGACFFVW
jgi:hypothetical protein